jgi:hypothetical protein
MVDLGRIITAAAVLASPNETLRAQPLQRRVDTQLTDVQGWVDLRYCVQNCLNGDQYDGVDIWEFGGCNDYNCVCLPDVQKTVSSGISSCISAACSDTLDLQRAISVYSAYCTQHSTTVLTTTPIEPTSAPAPVTVIVTATPSMTAIPSTTETSNTAANTLIPCESYSRMALVLAVSLITSLVAANTFR